MQNPWLDLPKRQPYVLAEDDLQVMRFNRDASAEEKIHTKVLPDPYLGRMDAPVIILGSHPGIDENDEKHHKQPEFQRACRANLAHEASDYPFYILHPQFSETPGYMWWHSRLRTLIEACGLGKVAQNVACVQYFPYHCERYGLKELVPSQTYGFYLVEQAMARQALIILMAGKAQWFKEIPALETYSHRYLVASPRSTYISPENCPEGYPKIVELLSS